MTFMTHLSSGRKIASNRGEGEASSPAERERNTHYKMSDVIGCETVNDSPASLPFHEPEAPDSSDSVLRMKALLPVEEGDPCQLGAGAQVRTTREFSCERPPLTAARFPQFEVWLKIAVASLVLACGLSEAAENSTNLVSAWTFTVNRWVDSSPAIGEDGTLYFGGFDQQFRAVNTNGKLRWSFGTGAEIRSSPALAPDGAVFFGCRDNKLYALTAGGKKKWEFPTDGWIDSSPALGTDGSIYFGSWDKYFYALRPDGAVKWKFVTGGPISSSPAIGLDESIFFGSFDRKFYALSAAGEKRWEFQTGGAILSSPAINAKGGIYFTSLDGYFYALDAGGGLLWKLHTGGSTDASPVIASDGTVYVDVNNFIWSITSEGKKKWEIRTPHPLRAPPTALADNNILILVFQGPMRVLTADRQELAAFPLWAEVAASPAINSMGTIHAFSGKGMNAFHGGISLDDSSWPKFRGNVRNTGNVRDGRK